MPTIVDSLVMLFSMKSDDKGRKQVEKDQKKTRDDAKHTANELNVQGKEAAQFFGRLRKEAIGFFAATAGARGLKDLLGGIIDSNAKLGLFAKNMDQSVGDIAMWQGAVERMGGSAEGVQSTIAGLTSAMAMFQISGDTSMLPWLRALNIQLTTDGVSVRNITDLFQEMHERLTTMYKDRSTAHAAGIKMGIDPGLLNVLLQTDKEFEKSIRIQQSRYITQEKDTAAALRFKQAVTDVGQSIRSWLTPMITSAIEALFNFSKWIDEHSQAATIFFSGLAGVITLLTIPAIVAFIAAWLPAIGMMLAIGAAIAVASVALGLFIEDWWVWLHDGDSALEKFWELWATEFDVGLNRSRAAFKKFKEDWKDELMDMVTWLKDLFTHPFETIIKEMAIREQRRLDREKEKKDRRAAQGIAPSEEGATVGLKNNNPGNLKFAGQPGATLGKGGFAKFESTEQGVEALRKQISKYFKDGFDTIGKVVNRYAPAKDGNDVDAYIKDVMGRLGTGAESVLGNKDIDALMRAIIIHENGRAGLDIAAGITQPPKEVPSPASGQVGAGASIDGRKPEKTSSNVKQEMNVGSITINTKATDANGVARGFVDGLRERGLVFNAESGLA